MDEDDDQRQFFADLAATARQGVEEVRGIEENYISTHGNHRGTGQASQGVD
jgi:hypothetical protein